MKHRTKIAVWFVTSVLLMLVLTCAASLCHADESDQTLHDKIVIHTPTGLQKRDVPAGSTVASTINAYKAQGIVAASLHTVSHCVQQTVPIKPIPLTYPNPFPAVMAPLSNDPLSVKQDSLYTSGWGSLPRVNNVKPVIVAIIDSGIDPNHPDLPTLVGGHSWMTAKINPVWSVALWRQFKRGDPGYVPQFIAATASDWQDEYGHGTHVAGIVGAVADNGIGIAGIAGRCNVQLMPLKALNVAGQGGTLDIANAIHWAADHGANVINMSLGTDYADDAMAEGCAYAIKHGCIVVCAAGNSGHSAPFYPAACPGVVSVGAVNRYGQLQSWSNRGAWVTVQAPGNNILSTMPTYPVRMGGRNYGYLSGTSMSAPAVAGECAYLCAANPDWTAAQVIAELRRSTVKGFSGTPVVNLSLLAVPVAPVQ